MSVLPHRSLEIEDVGEVTVVQFMATGILDEQCIRAIGERLFNLVDELSRKKILLNLGNVEYLSSAVFGLFITLNEKVNAGGGRLTLCNLDPHLYEVFQIAKLDKLL